MATSPSPSQRQRSPVKSQHLGLLPLIVGAQMRLSPAEPAASREALIKASSSSHRFPGSLRFRIAEIWAELAAILVSGDAFPCFERFIRRLSPGSSHSRRTNALVFFIQ